MKRLLLGTIVLLLAIAVPISTMAQINVNINIPLPPPVEFSGPPDVIAMPETSGVYVVPDIDVDLYFWNGFWWRLWEGRWYRSAYYDRDWIYYDAVPRFYFNIDSHWRTYYHNHSWYGHNWNYDRIPYQRLQQNWKSWERNRSWGGQRTWGVQGYPPRTKGQTDVVRQQRQRQYEQRPEVQKHMEYQRQQRQAQRPQVQEREQQQRHSQPSQQKPGRGEGEHKK